MRCFIDFESYYDKDVTLKREKLSITEYVRHPKFAVLGAALAIDDGEVRFLEAEALKQELAGLAWAQVDLVAHNMPFDGYVLHHVYGHRPRSWFCTMAASDALLQGGVGRSLDELAQFFGIGNKLTMPGIKGRYWDQLTDEEKKALAEYAIQDLELGRKLYWKFSAALPESEHKVMSLTLQMFCDPKLKLDAELANKGLEEARTEQEGLIAKTGHSKKEISGNISFKELLVAEGIEPPTKISPTTNEEADAFAKTDEEFMDLLNHENERVRDLVAARVAVKSNIAITRAERLIALGTEGDQLLAVMLNYYRAHTGRWTGGNKTNFQNLKKGSTLRKSILAPPGFVLGVADASQIECRVNAYLAGQEDLLEIFRNKGDPYIDLATEIFGFPVTKQNIKERFIGKQAELGLGFTMGAPKFQLAVSNNSALYLGERITLDMEMCQTVVARYRRKRHRIVAFWSIAEQMMNAMAYNADPIEWKGLLRCEPKDKMIHFPNGTYLYYPGMAGDENGVAYLKKLGNKYVTKFVHRGLITENIVQKFARDIIAWQMVNVAERYELSMTTHDEVVPLIPEQEAEEGLEWVLEQLRVTPPWAEGLPLDSEGGWDRCYSK
jgi:DNA polymerase bacteriophage-type